MLHQLKNFICSVLTYQRMIHSSELQKLISLNNKRTLILIDTPTHGNLGDQAIVLAERQFLEKNFLMYDICEFTQQEYIACEKLISKFVNSNDVILIHGGGFIGTLWPKEEEVFLRILNRFSQNKIVVFPQTVYFEKSEKGIVEELKEVLKRCRDCTLFCRDFRSFEFMTQKVGMNTEQCKYVPDIVTFLKYDIELDRKNRVLFCLRNDKEKILDEKMLQLIVDEVERKNFQIVYTDTVVPYRISKDRRKEEVSKKLQEFAQCKFVITDRLHGMLFAAITGTPCLFMDNCSKKVSGSYEWIKNLEYVIPLTDMGCLIKFISGLEDRRTYHYSNEHLQPYYAKMVDIIKEG